MIDSYQTIHYQESGPLAWITLNRPQAQNAITTEMQGELFEVARRLRENPETRAVLLNGSGEAFSVGEDLEQIIEGDEGALAAWREARIERNPWRALAGLDQVLIAAIDGPALGAGLELALACDLRLASQRARFAFQEVTYGLIPCAGGTQRLPRLVGRGKALQMILTGEAIDAQEAYRIGLLNKVVAPEDLTAEAERTAQAILAKGPLAVKFLKEAVNKGLELGLDQGLRLEVDLYMLLQTTQDRMEGIRAFLEKREPRFRGL